jgi:hypothetical protein
MSLPGYWFPGQAASDRVLVATSGFDGTLEETWLQVGPPAADRGWSLLLIAGPGQADTARDYPDASLVPDTDRWIGPWLDVATAAQFAAAAGGPVTERRFTALEGADGHCRVGNLPLSAAVLFDWLDETLAA